MLTPNDIRNPLKPSGYNYVYRAGGRGPVGNEKARGGKPWMAVAGWKKNPSGTGTAPAWRGPRRATAAEAAQDYCDYVGGNPSAHVPTPTLKTAGHNGRRQKFSDDPEVESALGVLRDAKGQREGKQGYVYCILETRPGGGMRYVKIGYSTNPAARVAELQTGNPRVLKLHSLRKGTIEDESAIHQKYIQQNVLQEWFRPTPELLLEFDLDANGQPFSRKADAA